MASSASFDTSIFIDVFRRRGATNEAEHEVLHSLQKTHPIWVPTEGNWLESGHILRRRLLVFNPSVVAIPSSIAPLFPKDEKRAGPIILRAALYRKTVHVKLREGFTVDEAPSNAKFASDFATFSLTFKQEPGLLVVTEELRTEAATLPPDQFQNVKTFFDNCHGADRQNAVLVKN